MTLKDRKVIRVLRRRNEESKKNIIGEISDSLLRV